MVKTPPKAKKSGDAIVPVVEKNKAQQWKRDARGEIVKLLMKSSKLSVHRDAAIASLPSYGRLTSESDLIGVKAILRYSLDESQVVNGLKAFFATKRK